MEAVHPAFVLPPNVLFKETNNIIEMYPMTSNQWEMD
jgi:hypothetical protein